MCLENMNLALNHSMNYLPRARYGIPNLSVQRSQKASLLGNQAGNQVDNLTANLRQEIRALDQVTVRLTDPAIDLKAGIQAVMATNEDAAQTGRTITLDQNALGIDKTSNE